MAKSVVEKAVERRKRVAELKNTDPEGGGPDPVERTPESETELDPLAPPPAKPSPRKEAFANMFSHVYFFEPMQFSGMLLKRIGTSGKSRDDDFDVEIQVPFLKVTQRNPKVEFLVPLTSVANLQLRANSERPA
jgi:hypothetical protein